MFKEQPSMEQPKKEEVEKELFKHVKTVLDEALAREGKYVHNQAKVYTISIEAFTKTHADELDRLKRLNEIAEIYKSEFEKQKKAHSEKDDRYWHRKAQDFIFGSILTEQEKQELEHSVKNEKSRQEAGWKDREGAHPLFVPAAEYSLSSLLNEINKAKTEQPTIEQPEEKPKQTEKPKKKEKPKKVEKPKEEKEGPTVGDEVMWQSQGELQWEKPKKITKIEEYKGQKFAFFEDSETGIPIDQLISEEEKKKPKKKKEKAKEPEKKEKPKKKKKPEKPKEKKEKPLTLDEKIAQKEKELEDIETKYNIYYSPVVQDLFGLYYRSEFKKLKKEVKELEKVRKKIGGEIIVEGAPEELPVEKKPTVKEYLEHIRSTDKLFTEMAKVRGAVKRGEKDPSEYEEIKERRRAAYRKTIEMEKGFSDKDIKKVIKAREKERKSKKWGLFRRTWEEFWNLLIKKFGKEIINEVTRDVLEQQLKVVREQIKKSSVLGRAALEKEEKRLEKRLRKFK